MQHSLVPPMTIGRLSALLSVILRQSYVRPRTDFVTLCGESPVVGHSSSSKCVRGRTSVVGTSIHNEKLSCSIFRGGMVGPFCRGKTKATVD